MALDGGGVRGIVALRFLAAFEERSGRKSCDAFDLFAGTSTGGIIAALLAFARMSAAEILDLYVRRPGSPDRSRPRRRGGVPVGIRTPRRGRVGVKSRTTAEDEK